jgi:cytochrome P450
MVLRQALARAALGGFAVRDGAGVLIYAPFFHRDARRDPAADRFDPDRWLGRDPADAAPFIPFSAGPAACPGRHLVSMLAAEAMAVLLRRGEIAVLRPRLDPSGPLPGTFDPFAVRLRIAPAARNVR